MLIMGNGRQQNNSQIIIDLKEIKVVSLQQLGMQIMQKQLDYAFELVSQPDNKSIKQGQALLNKLKSKIDYPILLFSYLQSSIVYVSKLRAAIQLRIWCDKYKNMQQFERNAYQPVIEDIKTNILFAFLSFDGKIQQTLLPGIVALTVVQFPDNWTGLISGLISYVSQHPQSTLKMLQLMCQITAKYSYSSRSDPLYNQIIIVCNQFQKFLLKLTIFSIQNILQNQGSPQQLKILQQEMILFYNLNYQDLHPEFEDNLPQWMDILNKVMKLPNNNQNFFKCKGAALQSILLYASKYKDDVEDSIKGFMEQIWTLCANASTDPEYDQIVTNALKYFKSLLLWQDMRQTFASNIDNLISNLILPNLGLTQSYKDMFQQDIQTFISYFFRNSQTLTRRSNAIELLQSIVRHFNQNFISFLQNQIKGFTPTPQNISMQCLLLTLIIQSAPKGFRDIDGTTSLQIPLPLITHCYETLIKSSLNTIFSKQSSDKPIQKQMNIIELLTTLRFIFYFRIYLPTEELTLMIRLCCNMCVENQSLKEVIVLVVSGLVGVRHGDYVRYVGLVVFFQRQKLAEVAGDVLNMISTYQKQNQQLSPSLNRLLYTVTRQLHEYSQKFYQTHYSPILKQMLCKTTVFTFSSVLPLFEAIGYLAYYLASNKSKYANDLENLIQHYFHIMIKSESDMLNFCFQVLAIFLKFGVGDFGVYEGIYGSVLRPENWTQENLSLISAYLQYIAIYITLNPKKIVQDKQSYEQILTKLIQLDHYQLFYRLLRWILKVTDMQGFYKSGYMHILTKGTQFIACKNTEGRKMGLIFLFELMFDYNTQTVVKCLNQIEPGFFESFLLANQDIIKGMQLLRNRKLMFGAICNALALRVFTSVQNYALMLNLLIQNTSGRFKRDNMLGPQSNQLQVKKESTYQKLAVFKQIDSTDRQIQLDEEMVLLQAYNVCVNNCPDLNNFINEKNIDRMKKIYEKNQNQNR